MREASWASWSRTHGRGGDRAEVAIWALVLRVILTALGLAISMQPSGATTLEEAFNSEMRTWMAAHGIARGSLAVMRNGRLVHAAGFGGRDANERVGVWSLSKAITATCVATLARDRLLSLTDPIGPLLSATFERYGTPEDARLKRATVLHLITHRSGLPTWVGGNRFAPGTADVLRTHEPTAATADQLLTAMLRIKLAHEPGEQYQYSNVGYLLLGRIIEQATGKSYEVACNDRVLEPSGLKGVRMHHTWGRLLDAAAGWEMSAAEYLAFARQLRPGRHNVLGPAAHAMIGKTDGFWQDDRQRTAYTLGVVVWPVANALPHLSHTGGWDWAQTDARAGPIDENSGTLFVLTSDGISWFVSFDRLARATAQQARGDLDQGMWRARRAVNTWPALDLFPAYGVGAPKRAE